MDQSYIRQSYPCEICGSPIYCADDDHYGDDYYLIDDLRICEDCIYEYIKKNKREMKIC